MINSNSKFQRKKIVICLFVLILLSLGVFIFRNTKPVLVIESVPQAVFSVPKSMFYALGKKEMNVKIATLVSKNLSLEQQMVDYQLLKKENDALKSQFQISSDTSQNLVSSKIIGFQGNGTFPSDLIINSGKKDGIKKGMSVIFQKYLIGKIDTVANNYSVVITPFNQKFRVVAKLSDTGANGILVGKQDFMLLDGVVITDNLSKGGVVVTKGEVDNNGIGVSPDIIVGKITSISKNETAPFQSAQVQPMIDFGKLIDVFVVQQM